MDSNELDPLVDIPDDLDPLVKPTVRVAGTESHRTEQLRYSMAQPWIGRLPGPLPPRNGSIAVCGYGPSLTPHIDEIRKFDFVMSLSGAHKVLLQAGIVPTWHHDIEPREHKATMLGSPHLGTHYIFAADAAPALFMKLRGFDVCSVNVVNPAWSAYLRHIPRGDWCIRSCGGVGGNGIALARYLGFQDIHVFGIDGNVGSGGAQHAGPHPKPVKTPARPCTYDGRTFMTHPGLLYQAQAIMRLQWILDDTKLTFHGDGLVQTMAKNPPQWVGHKVLFFRRRQLITDADTKLWAVSMALGLKSNMTSSDAEFVMSIRHMTDSDTVLDYGCGTGELAQYMPVPIWEYDPAVPAKRREPLPADVVVARYVLENVPPEDLDVVTHHLHGLTKKVALITIQKNATGVRLADGQELPLNRQTPSRWLKHLKRYFAFRRKWEDGEKLSVLMTPLPDVPTPDVMDVQRPIVEAPYVPEPLISPEYAALLQQYHGDCHEFGTGGMPAHRADNARAVSTAAQMFSARSILDYGAGKGTLAADMPVPIWEYDPGVPGKDVARPADLVVAVDVLEHIEPEYLDAVLRHIRSLCKVGFYALIATRLAQKSLPDGRNAHICLMTAEEWKARLEKYFHIIQGTRVNTDEYRVLAMPRRP